MTSRNALGVFACSLDTLMDEKYSYFQEEYIAEESLNPIFGDKPNKRKPNNRPYEWEYLYAE